MWLNIYAAIKRKPQTINESFDGRYW